MDQKPGEKSGRGSHRDQKALPPEALQFPSKDGPDSDFLSEKSPVATAGVGQEGGRAPRINDVLLNYFSALPGQECLVIGSL